MSSYLKADEVLTGPIKHVLTEAYTHRCIAGNPTSLTTQPLRIATSACIIRVQRLENM